LRHLGRENQIPKSFHPERALPPRRRILDVIELTEDPVEKLNNPTEFLEHLRGDVRAIPDVDLVENLATPE
jgi:hypothetical protein